MCCIENVQLSTDSLDLDIVKHLVKDARISYLQLAKKLKVSNSLIHQRIKRMKTLGVFENATYKLNAENLGFETHAYTGIRLKDSKYLKQVAKELYKIPEVVECVNVTGKYAFMIKVFAENNAHLHKIIYEKVLLIDGIAGTDSTIAFRTEFTKNLPLSI